MYDERHDREKRPDSICEVGNRDTRREEIGNSARSVQVDAVREMLGLCVDTNTLDTYRMQEQGAGR